MNELIKSIFNNFTVDGVKIPVKFLKYEGHDEPYVTYMQQDVDNSYSGDDELLGYVDYYDFDVYSKGNYTNIIEELKRILKENEFVWQPSRSSQDFYENDTGYYHKTLNFAIFKQEDI
jgi:predicted MPP superfamily phosphohydrolase